MREIYTIEYFARVHSASITMKCAAEATLDLVAYGPDVSVVMKEGTTALDATEGEKLRRDNTENE